MYRKENTYSISVSTTFGADLAIRIDNQQI